jgi:hypothetical protein
VRLKWDNAYNVLSTVLSELQFLSLRY